jgi:hypothetical protein
MCISRRHILGLVGSTAVSRIFAASLPGFEAQRVFDVDRLLNPAGIGSRRMRRYVASAAVTVLSIPVVSKPAVGSGYAVIEEADFGQNHAVSIQFGAGSWPENARGLNRLGFIQEAIIEQRPGDPSEWAWLAFMTTSKENNLDQAKKALEASGAMIPYSASQGYGRPGTLNSRVDRLEFPGEYTWRDIRELVKRAREAVVPLADAETRYSPAGSERPATSLYQVRRAMLDSRVRASSSLVFNSKQFRLDTQKETDGGATNYFSSKNLVAGSAQVIRLNATLTELRTGKETLSNSGTKPARRRCRRCDSNIRRSRSCA